jgi:predicted nucleotidyltransferase
LESATTGKGTTSVVPQARTAGAGADRVENRSNVARIWSMPDAKPIPTGPLDSGLLRRAREASMAKRTELDEILSTDIRKYASDDSSLVVFGSLARDEWTSGSDLDWTFLIDGVAKPEHFDIAQVIQKHIKKHEDKFPSPGTTGTFGNMAFSHDIVHRIGGQNDTNKNTTQRVLLLLESRPIGKQTEAYHRVIRAVVDRYLEEDTSPLDHGEQRYRVPRFLLNDIARFWRTMAVDFATKQRDRGGEEWGLRNAKLRMSRKLIFASGLLACFSVNLDPELQKKISTDINDVRFHLRDHIMNYVKLTPLEILAKSIESYDVSDGTAKVLFGAYTDFLEILDDKKSREALKAVRSSDSRTDPTFQRVRKISEAFEGALDHIFFENPQIKPLTRKYGVF